jgi:signal transduction histidine kinase
MGNAADDVGSSPWLEEDGPEAVADLWRAFERHYDAMWAHVIARTRAHPATGALARSISEDDLEARKRSSFESIRRGVLDGDWGPYEAHLRATADAYMRLGTPFGAWHVGARWRADFIAERLGEMLQAEPQRLIRALVASEHILDRTVVVLARAYLEAKAAELRASERWLATTLDSLEEAVITVDAVGRVLRMNPAAERLVRAAEPDAPLRERLPIAAGGVAIDVDALVSAALRGETVVELGPNASIDTAGGIRQVAGQVAPLRTLGGAVLVVRDVTDQLRDRAELRAREEELRALAQQLERAREEERTRIAREIHDQLGQQLTGLKIDCAGVQQRLAGRAPDLDDQVRAMAGRLDEAIGTVRDLATALRPPILDDLGLEAALQWQARDFAARSGIAVRVEAHGDDADIGGEPATALFRCFQEILTNVARHSAARRVLARLDLGEDFVLDVSDDGRGIAEGGADDPRSLGIIGMRERAAVLGGSLRVERSPAGGTRVTVTLPRPGGAR